MAAGAALFLIFGRATDIALTDAQLVPMGGGYALTVKIDNPGPPDRLIEVSTGEGQLMMAGASFTEGLPVPAGSTPALAMDGAHGMLMGLPGETEEGRLVPITLRFAEAGAVSTRARVAGGMDMDHSDYYPVPPDEPAPHLEMLVGPEDDGWKIMLQAENFTFSAEAADSPHVPGIGHGHLYLDGLKLGRVYGTEQHVGALPPGDHELRVTLNTNDHRAYFVDGAPVTAAARVSVD
nr:copper chaperone PCu(A)C [Pseudoruegeria sp. HB172150]